MKKYQVKIHNLELEIIQDDDGKFITPYLCIEDWQKFGSCLKPAYEPIIVARKPVEKSIIHNVLKYGVGGMNIDECRVEPTGEDIGRKNTGVGPYESDRTMCVSKTPAVDSSGRYEGRYPANVIHDGSDEAISGMPNTKSGSEKTFGSVRKAQEDNLYQLGINKKENKGQYAPDSYGDEGNASRYFYCAKASKFDRDEGLDEFEDTNITDGRKAECDRPYLRKETPRKNSHPTVKNCELMRYLVRLVSPKNATILDCFSGSGSTGKAVMLENKEFDKNYKYIGIELTDEYLPIAKARIEYIIDNEFVFEEKENNISEHKVIKKDDRVFDIFDFL